MTLLATLARLEAASAGRAVPLSRVRHRRLSGTPLVIVPLTLAGDPATPVAVATGTTRGAPPAPDSAPAAQPRAAASAASPASRRRSCSYITDRQQSTEPVAATRTQPARARYSEAPQVLVPNKAARDYLGLLGRSVRFERADGPYAVDPAVPALGKWLTWLADNSDEPGSALLADLTGFLSEHWATGQSPLEDANLAAQLAWIDPPPGMSGLQAALAAEDPVQCPPAGPATDPGFDRAVLGPLVHEYDRYSAARNSTGTSRVAAEIEDAFHGQVGPAWDAAWHAIALLRGLPEAPAAARRWADDRDHFTRYSDYLASDGRPQPRRDAPAAAAARLSRLERAQAAYDAQRALEDPYVFAGLRTTGEAFTGLVVSARADTQGPGRERSAAAAAHVHHPDRRPGPDQDRDSADLPVVPQAERQDHAGDPRRRPGRRRPGDVRRHGPRLRARPGAPCPRPASRSAARPTPATGPRRSTRLPSRPPGPTAGPGPTPGWPRSRGRDRASPVLARR